MELGTGGGEHTPPSDLAQALGRGARRLGHRPAVTVLHAFARYEQSGASLANWAAKGSHLLELDHLVGPDDAIAIAAPACWTTASAALAAWWLGAAVRLDSAGATVTIRHETAIPASDAVGEMLLVGDALDGGPTGPADHPVWTHEAQTMPDAPPAAAAGADRIALVRGAQRLTQQEVITMADDLGEGVLGVETDRVDPLLALVATAVRPLLTGRPTVVLRAGVGREDAEAERVSAWCPTGAG